MPAESDLDEIVWPVRTYSTFSIAEQTFKSYVPLCSQHCECCWPDTVYAWASGETAMNLFRSCTDRFTWRVKVHSGNCTPCYDIHARHSMGIAMKLHVRSESKPWSTRIPMYSYKHKPTIFQDYSQRYRDGMVTTAYTITTMLSYHCQYTQIRFEYREIKIYSILNALHTVHHWQYRAVMSYINIILGQHWLR